MPTAYHGTTEKSLDMIMKDGFLAHPFVTFNLKLAKAQASRRRGLAPLVVLELDISGYKLTKDPMFRSKSDDPLLGKTYHIKSNLPTSRIVRVIEEPSPGYWFDTISAPMYDKIGA